MAIKNFRSLKDVSFDVGPLTVLIGENGTGKSALLRALQFFFDRLDVLAESTDIDQEDCWGRREDLAVEVSLTFADLPDDLRERLRLHLDEAGQFTLTRRSELDEHGQRRTTHVSYSLRAVEFDAIRDEQARPARRIYEKLREEPRFSDLPAWQNQEQALSEMRSWEEGHRSELERVDDTSVGFGVRQGGLDLSPWFAVVSVPAVRDVRQDQTEARGSVFTQLTERLVWPHVSLTEPLASLRESSEASYREIIEQAEGALKQAEEQLSVRLAEVAPGTSIALEWQGQPPAPQPPSVYARLVEAGFPGQVGRQGHGVQRAFLLALLRELAARPPGETAQEHRSEPLLVLLVEEPELYQHPTRARLFARVLGELAEDRSHRAQTLYTTHSPLFVSLDRVEALRLLRIEEGSDPPATVVHRVDLAGAALRLQSASEGRRSFTSDSLRGRLRHLLDTPLSEGFFARAVVLVEGDADRAMLMALAEAQRVDLLGSGIAVLPAGGKGNLDKPYLVFDDLSIPTYLIFDGDAHKKEGERDVRSNRRLLHLLGEPPQDSPSTTVQTGWASFEEDMVRATRSDVGKEVFERARSNACRELKFPEGESSSPLVLGASVRNLAEQGDIPQTLASIVGHIAELPSAG